MKYFFIILMVLLIGCENNNENKITIDKNEYDILKNDFINLQNKYAELNNNYIQQSKEFQIIKNYNEAINYEKLWEGYNKREEKSIQIIEEDYNSILMDYYGDGTHIFGLTVFCGHYTKIKKIVEDEQEIDCDGFIITDAPVVYLNSIKKLLFAGNAIYDMDSTGNIIVTIKINQLSDNLKKIILNSNNKNKIKILVYIKKPYPGCVDFPFMDVLDAKQVDGK